MNTWLIIQELYNVLNNVCSVKYFSVMKEKERQSLKSEILSCTVPQGAKFAFSSFQGTTKIHEF